MLRQLLSPDWPARAAPGRFFPWLIIVLSLALLLPVVYVGIYNQPCPADDFGNADWDHFFGTQATMYLHWSGRYFNNFALLLCPLHWHSFSGYRGVIIALMLLLIWLFSFLVASGLKTETHAPKSVRFAAGLAAAVLVFNNMESLAEGFFWYAGAITYMVPAILFILFALLVLRIDKNPRYTIGEGIIAGLLVICIIGGNETMMLFCDVTCVCLLFYYRSNNRPGLSRLYGTLVGICIICTAFAVFAPGNFQRQSVNPRNVWMVFPTWLYYSQKLAAHWLLDPFLLLFSVVFLMLIHPYPSTRFRINLLAAFLLPFAILLLLSFPGHYGLGTAPPPRINNIIYIFFVAGWVCFLLQLSSMFKKISGKNAQPHIIFRQITVVVMLIALAGSFNTHDLKASNVFKVVKGLAKGIPQYYYREVAQRFERIHNSTTDTVAVPDLKYKENNVLYLADIISRKTSSSNRSIAKYCGKAAVYIAPDSMFRH